MGCSEYSVTCTHGSLCPVGRYTLVVWGKSIAREQIQSGATIARLNFTWYYIELSNYSGRTQIRNLNSQHTPHDHAHELRGVYCEDLGENWPCYNGTALCVENLEIRLQIHKKHPISCPHRHALFEKKWWCSTTQQCLYLRNHLWRKMQGVSE